MKIPTLNIKQIKIKNTVLYFLILTTLQACSFFSLTPDLGDIYNESAQYHGLNRNPIIVIPGILGSNLVEEETGKSIWGAWDGDFANPNIAEEARLIALPLEEKMPETGNGIIPNGALDKVRLRIFGMPVQIRTYAQLLLTLGIGGYKDETFEKSNSDIDYGKNHYSCFQFDYDWRLDNAENAKRLKAFILKKKEYIQAQYQKEYGPGNYDIKFNIVAHSMGNLLARYFFRYGDQPLSDAGELPELTWEGAKYISKYVAIAPPNGGSTVSVDSLLKGRDFGFVLPTYSPTILSSFPSIYQLLPRDRYNSIYEKNEGKLKAVNIFDVEVWQKHQLGMLHPKQDKELKKLIPEAKSKEERFNIAKKALELRLNRAKRFHEALDKPAKYPKSMQTLLIAGDSMPTASKMLLTGNGKYKYIEHKAGDGIVLRSSTLLDERKKEDKNPKIESPLDWDSVLFIFEEHLELTKSTTFSDNILFFLLHK